MRHTIDGDRIGRYRAAVGMAPDGREAPPTYAAVYCLLPVLSALFDDPALGLPLAGLIHSEQSFEWGIPVGAGDSLEAGGSISSVESKRGLVMVGVDLWARDDRGRSVCSGRSVLLMRSGG